MQDEIGHPYNMVPQKAFLWGSGGGYKWGATCGALTSAAQIINLMHDKETSSAMINNLYAWYSQEEHPNYQPEGQVVTSVSDSVLCHVSVSTWLAASGVDESDPLKKKRCGGLTADVVKLTVEMMNNHADGNFAAMFAPAATVDGCMSCHKEDTVGKDDCSICHEEKEVEHW